MIWWVIYGCVRVFIAVWVTSVSLCKVFAAYGICEMKRNERDYIQGEMLFSDSWIIWYI